MNVKNNKKTIYKKLLIKISIEKQKKTNESYIEI